VAVFSWLCVGARRVVGFCVVAALAAAFLVFSGFLFSDLGCGFIQLVTFWCFADCLLSFRANGPHSRWPSVCRCKQNTGNVQTTAQRRSDQVCTVRPLIVECVRAVHSFWCNFVWHARACATRFRGGAVGALSILVCGATARVRVRVCACARVRVCAHACAVVWRRAQWCRACNLVLSPHPCPLRASRCDPRLWFRDRRRCLPIGSEAVRLQCARASLFGVHALLLSCSLCRLECCRLWRLASLFLCGSLYIRAPRAGRRSTLAVCDVRPRRAFRGGVGAIAQASQPPVSLGGLRGHGFSCLWQPRRHVFVATAAAAVTRCVAASLRTATSPASSLLSRSYHAGGGLPVVRPTGCCGERDRHPFLTACVLFAAE